MGELMTTTKVERIRVNPDEMSEPKLLRSARNRETGTLVETWRDLDYIPGYHIVCCEHAFVSHFDHLTGPTGAAGFAAHPKTEGWCEVCSGEYVPEVDA